MADVIVLDASVLIAYLDRDDAHHTLAEALLTREVDDDFAVNTLTLAEVLVAPARDDRLGVVYQALRELDVQELPFPDHAATRLAQLRATTNLKMPDCCALLAAEHARARIASFDARLTEAAARLDLIAVAD